MEQTKKPSFSKLLLSVLLDGIGLLSYVIPWLGEWFDAIWAPIAAFAMRRMYPDKIGKVASIIAFVEEAIPGTDIIPTFTITWCYSYFVGSKSKNETPKLED